MKTLRLQCIIVLLWAAIVLPCTAQNDLVALLAKASAGDPVSQDALGVLYALGNKDVPRNYPAAVKWFRKAALQDYADSQYRLGTMYEAGRGVNQDLQEAMKWYSLAAKQGQLGAELKLAKMYEAGRGVSKNFGEAAKWYQLAAEHGNADAQYKIGYFCQQGLGVPLNNEQAVKWYQKAAAQGNHQAIQALVAIGAQ